MLFFGSWYFLWKFHLQLLTFLMQELAVDSLRFSNLLLCPAGHLYVSEIRQHNRLYQSTCPSEFPGAVYVAPGSLNFKGLHFLDFMDPPPLGKIISDYWKTLIVKFQRILHSAQKSFFSFIRTFTSSGANYFKYDPGNGLCQLEKTIFNRIWF